MRFAVAASLLLSSIAFPALASASTPDAAAANMLRVSTGVIAPAPARAIRLDLPSSLNTLPLPNDAQVQLFLTVDEKGQAHNVQVTKSSVNGYWNARVVDAIQKAKYNPANIDNKPIPMDLVLTVNIAR